MLLPDRICTAWSEHAQLVCLKTGFVITWLSISNFQKNKDIVMEVTIIKLLVRVHYILEY